jgi:hypothetical protein
VNESLRLKREPAAKSGVRQTTARGLADIHVENNARTASHWELYAEHRERLNALVAAHGKRPRVAILGAGNGNDLDLDALARQFRQVHLADVDGTALERSARRASPEARRRLELHRGRDLSGLLPVLPAWRDNPPSPVELEGAISFAGALVASRLPGPFDLVVSDCLLSQISWTCFQALSEGPLLNDVLEVALAAHLRALVALTKPGGRALLVTDVVSTETVALDDPALDRATLLRELDRDGALFSGTSPSLALSTIARDATLSREIVDAFVVEPWVWRLSARRSVLVTALSFARRAHDPT